MQHTRFSVPFFGAWVGTLGSACLIAACSPSGELSRRDGGGPTTVPETDGSTTTRPDGSRNPNPNPGPCNGPEGDRDNDGWQSNAGDCDDCSNVVNPGAYDFPGNGADEDCSGADATAAEAACDTGLAIDSTNAMDAARAIGLCTFTDEASRRWGVISARFVRADGEPGLDGPLQTGLLPGFGRIAPPQGRALLALSSGIARAPNQAGYTTRCDYFETGGTGLFDPPRPPAATAFPEGFPVESPSCPGVTTGEVYNAAALEVRIRVPSNARSLRFRSNFYTYEYPDYICSEYNDFFVALMTPRPAGLENDNIVFDTDNNLVSVNTSLLRVCEPGTHNGKDFDCPLGTAELQGTGYNADAECGVGAFGLGGSQHTRAATGWLRTSAPVTAGQIITLRFTVWDSGDPDLDSTVLIDDFGWDIEDAPVRTEPDLI